MMIRTQNADGTYCYTQDGKVILDKSKRKHDVYCVYVYREGYNAGSSGISFGKTVPRHRLQDCIGFFPIEAE